MKDQKGFIESCLEVYQQRSFLQAYNKTFELIRADGDVLREKVFRLRYDVFCEENKFERLSSHHAPLEYDAFDERSVHYLLMHKPTGEAAGTLRVVLPNDEYPSESFLVQQHCAHPLVHSDSKTLTLCEISRFCMSKKFRKRERDGRVLSAYYDQDTVDGKANGQGNIRAPTFRRTIPYAPAALLQGAFETALSARILDGVWMVDSCHLSSLEKIGFTYHVLGPHVQHHGGSQPIVFNIKNVLDSMRRKNRHCWDVVSDLGRLQKIADDLHQNDWHDNLLDEAAWDAFYEQGVSGEPPHLPGKH